MRFSTESLMKSKKCLVGSIDELLRLFRLSQCHSLFLSLSVGGVRETIMCIYRRVVLVNFTTSISSRGLTATERLS